MNSTEEGVIERKSYARVGLLGNPSDVYFGKTISFSLGNFWASVRLEPSHHLLIKPHPIHDLVQFDSPDHLALISTFCIRHERAKTSICFACNLVGCKAKVTMEAYDCLCQFVNSSISIARITTYISDRLYDTNIPRQTGLSGSSAIVSATLNCLLDFYNVRHLIKVEVRPNLILSAEKELGLVAGLQDRVAQVYGGLVHMDFSKEQMDKLGHGIYTPIDIGLLPPLHLIYAENPSDSGKVHSTVRQRWLDGDEFVISTMKEVADIAAEGKSVILQKNYQKLAELMNRKFDLRRRMFGDKCLGALNIEMVEVSRRVGAASKLTRSGGAVVVFCPDVPSQVKHLEDEC